jgi:hypothetical protein
VLDVTDEKRSLRALVAYGVLWPDFLYSRDDHHNLMYSIWRRTETAVAANSLDILVTVVAVARWIRFTINKEENENVIGLE